MNRINRVSQCSSVFSINCLATKIISIHPYLFEIHTETGRTESAIVCSFFSSTCHLQNTLLFWCLHCLLYYSLLPVKLLPVLCAVILEQSLMCFIVFWIRGIRVLVLTASQSGCFCRVWPSVLTLGQYMTSNSSNSIQQTSLDCVVFLR